MITFLGLSPSLDITYLVDAVRLGEIHRPSRVLRLPGGKSLNAARAATALGGSVRAITPVGGLTGDAIAEALAAAGVATESIRVGGETRSCVSVFDESAEHLTEFYEQASDLDDAEWMQVVAAADRVADGWLALSGSVPTSRAADVANLLAGAAGRGIRVAVDTHGEALRVVLDTFPPAVVKVNRAEAVELLGEGDAAELARRLSSRADIAIVTDGAAGSVLASAEGRFRATPPERGRFTVGSGDCFLGGLIVALDSGSSTAGALALATAAAAANTLAPGAAVFGAVDVERIRRGVAVDAA